MAQSTPFESVYVFSALLAVLCLWMIFYLFFSAWVIAVAVSFLLNTLVLQGKSAIQIRAIHFALLRGMIILRDVTYTTPNISVKMVDCVLSMPWWRTWSRTKALVHLTSRGLECFIFNNGEQYDHLDRILKKRERGAPEQGVNIGLDVPPDAPLLFWLSKTIVINLSYGCIVVGNAVLPTALVISFQKARGTASLVDREPSSELKRVEAAIDLHECTAQVRENKGWKDDAEASGAEAREKRAWQSKDTWQYWEGLSALKEGLSAPLNFLRVRGDNAESSPDSSGRGEHNASDTDDGPSIVQDAPGSLGAAGAREEHDKERESGRREGGKRLGQDGRGAGIEDKKGVIVGNDHILKTPLIQLKYYDDLCGYIADAEQAAKPVQAASNLPQTPTSAWPRRSSETTKEQVKRTEDVVPERGIVLDVAHASLTYGPWEDRQRAWLQGFFMPPDYETRDAHVRKAGYITNRSAFRTLVTFRGSVRIHVPFSRDPSARDADFRSPHARAEGCSNFLTLASGTPIYVHSDDLVHSDRPTSGTGETSGKVAPSHSVAGHQGAQGSLKRAAGAEAHIPSPSYTARGVRSDGATGRAEDDDTDRMDDGSDSDSEFSDDSRDSYQSSDASGGSEYLEEEEDEEWSEILARSGGCVISTDVEVLHDVRIASNLASALEKGVFWRSEGLRVSVDLKLGLAFHDSTSMEWDVESSCSTVYLLRDHTRLIQSVLADWGWRPNVKRFSDLTNDPLYFVPSVVRFRLNLVDQFKLGLILNEDNIVDDFADEANNTVLWLRARSLTAKTCTRNETFQPSFGNTEYSVYVPDIIGSLEERQPSSLDIQAPVTLPECLRAAALEVQGDYTGWRQTNTLDSPLDTSSIKLDFRQLNLLGHGMLLEGIFALIRNYFGSVSVAITAADFEQTQRSDFEKARNSPERAIPGWNRKMQALLAYNAAKKVRPHPCEVVLRVSLMDVVVEVPQHESITAARRLCACAVAREVFVEMRSMPDLSQLVVTASPISLECASTARASSPGYRAARSVRSLGPTEKYARPDKHPSERLRGSGTLIIDGVEYSADSCLGPSPEFEAYKTHTRLHVGRINGDVSPGQLVSVMGAIKQLTGRNDVQRDGKTTNIPGRLWLPNLAHNTVEVWLAPVCLTTVAPTFLADINLEHGLSIKGNNLVCSSHNSITTIEIPAVSAALHQRVQDHDCKAHSSSAAKVSERPSDGYRKSDDRGKGEQERDVRAQSIKAEESAQECGEILEVASVTTSLKLSLTSKSSEWERDCLEQYKFLVSQDRGTRRHGLHEKMRADDSECYHDADEPTRSHASEDEDGARGNAQSERTEEVFLTADDFVTSDDVSTSSFSDQDEFASPLTDHRRSASGISGAEALRQRMRDEEAHDMSQSDARAYGEKEDVMYSAPTTPTAAQTPKATSSARSGAVKRENERKRDSMPYLSKRAVLSKTFVKSSVLASQDSTEAGQGSSFKVGSSFASIQQIRRQGSEGSDDEEGSACLLDPYRLVRRAIDCAEEEPEPWDPGQAEKTAPEPKGFEKSSILREKADQVSSLPAGGWQVTAELASVASHDRSFPYSHKDLLRHASGDDDLRARSPVKASADSHLSKFPLRAMKRSQSLPGSDWSKAGSQANISSSVSLGLVTHSSYIEVGVLLARACPQAVDTLDDLMLSLPNDSSCVEGCLDLMHSLAKDPREEPASFAFYGMHRVKREFRFKARALEFQLLQRLPTCVPTPLLRGNSPIDPSLHAGPSLSQAATVEEFPAPPHAGHHHGGSVQHGGSRKEDAIANETSEDMAETRSSDDNASLAGGDQGHSDFLAVSLALTDVTMVKSDAFWCDSSQKQLAGNHRRLLVEGAGNGLPTSDLRDEPGKVAGHAARHMRNLYTSRKNVSKVSGTCGSLLGVVHLIPKSSQHAYSQTSAPGNGGDGADAIPLDLLARTCPGSTLDADTAANRAAIFVIHGQNAISGDCAGGGQGAPKAQRHEEADGSDPSGVLSFSVLKRTLSGAQGPQTVASGIASEQGRTDGQEGKLPVVLKATICPLLVLSSGAAAGAMLPAAYVWNLASEKLSRTLKERRRVAERNVNLVLDQSIPEIQRQAPKGLSRSKSVDNLHSQSRGPQYHLPKVHLLRRSQSDKPKSALKAKSSGAGRGGGGNSLPKLNRHKSDDASSERYSASSVLERAICYKQVVCFVRNCSQQDLRELEAALSLPITWSMVSHRTWDNIANVSEVDTPFSKSTETINLEAVVQVQGFKMFLVHRDALKDAALAHHQAPPGTEQGVKKHWQASQFFVEASTLMCVSTLRCDTASEAASAAESRGDKAADTSAGARRALVRDVVCQLTSGKWQMHIFPPAVGVAANVLQLMGGDAEQIARNASPGYGARPSPASEARVPSPVPIVLHRRSVSFKDEAADNVTEVAVKDADSAGAVSWAEAAATMKTQGARESDGVCLVLPFQGSLKHVSMEGELDPGGSRGARGASLAAALSATEGGAGGGGWGWGSSGKYGRMHRRTGSLPSASAIQWALDISDALAASHAQRVRQHKNKSQKRSAKKIPVMMHMQMCLQAEIQAELPGQGRWSVSLATASAAVTRHPKKVGATAAHLDTSLCLSFEEVALQLVKQGVETGPRIVSSNLRANLLSSSVSAPSKQMSGVGVNDLKAHVLRSKRRNMTVTLDMDTLEVKDLHLHEVDGTFAHKMMSAWIPAAVGEKCMASRVAPTGASLRRQTLDPSDVYPSDAAHVAHARPLAAANALDLTLRVRNCRADVRVMRNVGLTYETYDKENRGLYATIRHFAQPLDASSLASSTVASKKHDGVGAVDGKLLSQSELCFRLHKSRLRTDKKDYESGQLLSQATFYFPDVQAAGTMKTRFNNMSAFAHVPAHAPGDGASASAAGHDDVKANSSKSIPTITDVNVTFSIKEMCNEVRQDMLNFLLEMQRTMKTEINMFLQATEKYAASLGKKREMRAAMGVQLHFHFRFLLTGIRLRAVAPDTALLLDTGFFTLEVVGRPAGACNTASSNPTRENKALQWKIGLEGLSIAATSWHQRPGIPGRPLEKEASRGDSAGSKTWVLAHVRTNLEMQNRAEELTLDDKNPVSSRAPPAPGRASAAGHNFSLNLAGTEALAHPGSVGCLRKLYNHFNQAVAEYQHQRQFIHLEELDSSIQRMVQTGRDAAQGRIKKAAPVLMKRLSNFSMQVAIRDTWLSLINSQEVSSAFSFNVPSHASPAAIFSKIDLRGLSKRVTGSPQTSRAGDDNSLIAFLELIELRTQTTAEGTWKRVQAHLKFRRLEVGFASSHTKAWNGHAKHSNNVKPAQRGRKAFESLRYNPGRVVLESSSANLQVVSDASAKLANAEEIQGNLDMKLPGFDVEVNARSFESAFIFYNAWTATAGASLASAPLSPTQNTSPPSAAGRALSAGSKAVSPIVRAVTPQDTGSDGDEGALLQKEQHAGDDALSYYEHGDSAYKGAIESNADRMGVSSAGAGAHPQPYEPDATIAQGPTLSKQRSKDKQLLATTSVPAAGARTSSVDQAGGAGLLEGAIKVTPMEAYRAKLRLLSLDVKVVSSAGHLTVFEKDAEGGAHPRNAGQGGGLQSRGDEAGAGKGVLLNVPLPEFDVAGNTTLVLALGGLGRHSVEWLSPGEVLIDKVPVQLPDSILLCVFRMPKDDGRRTQSLWLSPSILELVEDIQGLHRKHRKHYHFMHKPPSRQAPQHGQKIPAAAAASVSSEREMSPNSSFDSPQPGLQSARVDPPDLQSGLSGGLEGRAAAGSVERDSATSAGVTPGPARAVSGLDSTTVLMSDVIYSMRFADLELKLSAGERVRDNYDSRESAAGSQDDVLALLSAQVLDVTVIVSRKQHLLLATSAPVRGTDKTAWFSSVAMRLERLSLQLAQQPQSPMQKLDAGGGAGGAEDGWQAEGGFVELRDISGSLTSRLSDSADPRTETSVLVVVRMIDSYLNLRSLGKGLTLLKAWLPSGRGGLRKKSQWGQTSPVTHTAASSPHAGTAGAGIVSAGDKAGYGAYPRIGARERHVRATLVLSQVDLRLEHPLGSTRCQLLNSSEAPRGQRAAAVARRSMQGAGSGRVAVLPGLTCGFEVGILRNVGLQSGIPPVAEEGSPFAAMTDKEGDRRAETTALTDDGRPTYWLRLGKAAVFSPRDVRRNDSEGLDMQLDVQRILLHSHAQAREDAFDSSNYLSSVGWHGELSKVKALLKFDSLVFMEFFADELQACSHVGAPSSVPAHAHKPTAPTGLSPKPHGHSSSAHFGVGAAAGGMGMAGRAPAVADADSRRTSGVGVHKSQGHLWIRYRKLVLRASAETAPTCRRILKRLVAQFQDNDLGLGAEADGASGPSRRPSFRAFAASPSAEGLEDDELAGGAAAAGAKQAAQAESRGKIAHLDAVLGSVNIAGKQLHIALYAAEMNDASECAMLVLQQLNMLVEVNREEEAADVYRFLELGMASCLVIKVKKGPLPKIKDYENDHVTVDTIKLGRAGVRLAGAESIFDIPHAKLDMSAVQTGSSMGALSQLVHCEVDTSFNNHINVSYDPYLYQFLATLVRRFVQQLSALDDDDFEPFSPAARKASRDLPGGSVSSPSGSITTNTSKWGSMRGGGGGGRESKKKLDYRCLHFKLDPQIASGGDAFIEQGADIVKILNLLGVKTKESICSAINEVFILSMERVLKIVVRFTPMPHKRDSETAAGAAQGTRRSVRMSQTITE